MTPTRSLRVRGGLWRTGAATASLAAALVTIALPARSQSWLDFAHPGSPHDVFGDGSHASVPLSIPGLLQGTSDVVVNRPVLVVLMEWSDMTHRAVHSVGFWDSLVFGNPRGGARPSLFEIYDHASNGRLRLTRAINGDTYDGSQDGIVGWVRSDSSAFQLTDTNRKRAEAIRVADPLFDYRLYDANSDGRITTNELIVIAVFADNAPTGASCDQHIGHPNPPGCVGTPGGNTRPTDPLLVRVDGTIDVHQWIAGVGEMAHVGVVAHEVAHSSFGHGDLYAGGCGDYQVVGEGYTCGGVLYPPPPGHLSIMDKYWLDYVPYFEAWGAIHLGFTFPRVVTHDGTYALYDAETKRQFSAQASQPEALIVYDPLRSEPYEEYFILENRNLAQLRDRGLAVWVIREDSVQTMDWRRVVRLIRRAGHWAPDEYAQWDGAADSTGYNLTDASTPRNTGWSTGGKSYVEIRNISPAGPVMTMDIVMPPIFVDRAHGGAETGSQTLPFNTVGEAITAIPVAPRTIRVAGGNYPSPMTITTPCRLKGWKNGTATIGR